MGVKIPVYEQQTTARGLIEANPEPRRLVPAINELPNAVGSAMEGFGQSVQHVAREATTVLAAKEEADAHAQLRKNLADNYQSWTEFEQSSFDNAANGAHGHAGQVMQAFDKWMPEALATVQSPAARQKYEESLYNLRSHLFDRAIVNEAHAAVADRTTKVTQTAQSYALQAYNGTISYDQAHSLTQEAVDGAGFDPVTRAKLSTTFAQGLSDAYLQGTIRRNPAMAKEQFSFMQGENEGTSNKQFSPHPSLAPEDAAAIAASAKKLGVSPNDLQAVIQYESGFNPSRFGGKGGKYLGLIQFGPEEQQTYGVRPGQSVKEQLNSVERFLKDRGLRPGDDLSTMYKIINGGNRNVSGGASDGNGTIDQHVQNIRALQRGVPLNPEFAKAVATAGPDKITTFTHLADQQIRGNEVELDRIRVDQDRAKKEAQQQQLSAFLPKLTQGQLTADEVLSNQTLDFSQKEHLINGIAAQAKGLDNTTPSVFIDVFNRIHAQPGDATRITDPDQLNAYIGHGISFTDIQRLRGELQGKNDPDKNLITDFKKMAKSQLSKASMLMADPEGDKNYYEWEINFNKLLEDKRKEGKSIMQLLDPQSKDYLGYTIKPRTIQQAIQSQANAIRESAPGNIPDTDKRRPGESMEDWAARTNQFGKMGAAFDKATGKQ